MATTLETRDHGYDRVMSALRAAAKRDVRVGFMGRESHRGSAADLATIAAVHEFGVEMSVTPRQSAWMGANLGTGHRPGQTLTIPARPVVGPAFDAEGRKIAAVAAQSIADGAERGEANTDTALARLGFAAEALWKNAYVNARNTVDPLSPVTIAERAKRSIGSDAPLIDTGQLVGAVKSEVR